MNTESNAVLETSGVTAARLQPRATRPFYWSVRREFWENRSIYIAPLIVAVVVLFGFLISTVGLPERRRAASVARSGAAARRHRDAVRRSGDDDHVHGLHRRACFTVSMRFYSERRDRSILFWKSLPVSDLTTVLSKATIPLVVLPVVTFAVIVATQFVMLLWTTSSSCLTA